MSNYTKDAENLVYTRTEEVRISVAELKSHKLSAEMQLERIDAEHTARRTELLATIAQADSLINEATKLGLKAENENVKLPV